MLFKVHLLITTLYFVSLASTHTSQFSLLKHLLLAILFPFPPNSSLDVDDKVARNLAEAFRENESVKTLGLAHNMIGTYETLRTTQPDFKTGAESLADMLLFNCTITELDLSWNSIRLDSAVALGTVWVCTIVLVYSIT